MVELVLGVVEVVVAGVVDVVVVDDEPVVVGVVVVVVDEPLDEDDGELPLEELWVEEEGELLEVPVVFVPVELEVVEVVEVDVEELPDELEDFVGFATRPLRFNSV